MEKIHKKFGEIQDIRHQGYVKHKLSDILIIVFCAVLCGIDELADIVTFGKERSMFFKNHFNIDKVPSKSTISRILNMVNGQFIAKAIIEIMRENFKNSGEIIAFDGKAIRSTSKKGEPHSALQIMTAYLTQSGVVLGQEAIREKTNEIPIMQEMLELIDIKGKIITADAMHCQSATCEKIIDKGGNYLFGLKENQKSSYEAVKMFFESETAKNDFEIYKTSEKHNGRIENRICSKINDISGILEPKKFKNVSSIFSIKRITETKYGISEETNFYISSLEETPRKLLEISREHWKIESMHWMLDVVWNEDNCCLLSENGHKTLNAFRKLALLIHKNFINQKFINIKNKPSIKQNLLKCLISESKFCELLQNL